MISQHGRWWAKPRSAAVVGALVVVLAGAALWGRASSKQAAPGTDAAKAALSVTVTKPQLGDWPQTLPATGSIAAWQEAVIGAEQGGLRLVEVRVNVGDRVKRGQVLARMQGETLGAEVAQTRANVAEAAAVVAEAQANAERARQLQATGAISAQQINQYLTAEQTARARAQALRARLQADELRLAQTRIVAPDNGVISARLATEGQVVQPGQELFRLIRQERLEWRAEVSARELVRLKPGMKAQVTTAYGAKVAGRVRTVAPTVDVQTRNGLVYVDLAGKSDAKAGMFVRGSFELGRSRGMTLPQSAVLLREGFSYVFGVGGDNRVRQLKVTVGQRMGDRVQILSGLSPNARVVAGGGGFLSDGDVVRIVQ